MILDLDKEDIIRLIKYMKSQIDFKNKKIYGKSGKVYHIDAEGISSARWQEYMIQSASLGLGVMFQDVFDSYAAMYKAVTTGNDILKALKTVQTICEDKLKFIDRYHASSMPKVCDFCALFCNEPGEDIGVYDITLRESKTEDWGEIPIRDFFLLSAEVIPAFKENYKKLTEDEGKSLTEILNQTQSED